MLICGLSFCACEPAVVTRSSCVPITGDFSWNGLQVLGLSLTS
jgi:hypothetical protein